jgi:hypothetical protein
MRARTPAVSSEFDATMERRATPIPRLVAA